MTFFKRSGVFIMRTRRLSIIELQRITSIGLIFILLGAFFVPYSAYAADLTSKSDTMTSLKASTVANHTILFTTPTGIAAGETITLTFASFLIAASLDFEDLDMSTEASGGDGVCDTGDSEKTLAASASGTTWGAVRTTSTVLTFTSGTDTIAAGSEICIEIGTNAEEGATGTEQMTNPTAGSYTLVIAGVQTDSGKIAIQVITDDQVVNTGIVAESLSFSISDVTIGFGALVTANARYATGDAAGSDTDPAGGAHTITAGTNGTDGYTLFVNGTTLTSGTDTVDAMSTEATSAAGTEQYGIRITVASGPEVPDSVYDNSPADSFALDTASFPDTIATASGSSADTVYEVHYIANIASNIEPGSYSSVLTYSVAGNF